MSRESYVLGRGRLTFGNREWPVTAVRVVETDMPKIPHLFPGVKLEMKVVDNMTQALGQAGQATKHLSFKLSEFAEKHARRTLSKRAFRRWRGKRAARRRELRLKLDTYTRSLRAYAQGRPLGETYLASNARDLRARPARTILGDEG